MLSFSNLWIRHNIDQVPSDYVASFPFVKYFSEIFLTKQLIFFSKFTLDFRFLGIPALFLPITSDSCFLWNKGDPLLIQTPVKGRSFGGKNDKQKTLGGNTRHTAGIRVCSGWLRT
jgi:hypothetical protein